MSKALITGINGQDGIFLSRLLIAKNYQVVGLANQKSPSSHLDMRIKYYFVDIRDTFAISEICKVEKPDEVYNLAGISSVARSFDDPKGATETNFQAVYDLFEVLSKSNQLKTLRFFQASSSEMFGVAVQEPQDEDTPLNPVSPYAIAKFKAHRSARNFRDKGFFVSCGILYNHESIYRPKTFVTRKITSGVASIKSGNQSKLLMGNVDAERDWGFAGDYVEAMYLSLQHSEPDDFVIASGRTHSVRELLKIAFDEAGMSGGEQEFVEIDQNLLRPKEVNRLIGNYSKASNLLSWKPKVSFEEMIREMVRFDLLENAKAT
jgi:GDPmannose 4,6-dehydratase